MPSADRLQTDCLSSLLSIVILEMPLGTNSNLQSWSASAASSKSRPFIRKENVLLQGESSNSLRVCRRASRPLFNEIMYQMTLLFFFCFTLVHPCSRCSAEGEAVVLATCLWICKGNLRDPFVFRPLLSDEETPDDKRNHSFKIAVNQTYPRREKQQPRVAIPSRGRGNWITTW